MGCRGEMTAREDNAVARPPQSQGPALPWEGGFDRAPSSQEVLRPRHTTESACPFMHTSRTSATRFGLAVATAGVLLAGAHLEAQSPTPDFNDDGVVDLADFEQLRGALGSSDAAYDMTGDGVVDTEDFHAFGDRFSVATGASAAGEAAGKVAGRPPYELMTTRMAVAMTLPDYSVVVQRAAPFGIISLRLHGQPVDFVSPSLPVADWEWFWFEGANGVRSKSKLLLRDWGPPTLIRGADYIELIYTQRDVLRPGLSLHVGYQFSARGPNFQATYTIENDSGRILERPYAMVGFPGFADHRWISEVADARQRLGPRGSHRTFWEEVLGLGRDYELLRHEAPHPALTGMKAEWVIESEERRYALKSYYLTDESLVEVYSAQTNKPGYLTSHLYATFADLPSGHRRRLSVAHGLSVE